MAKMPAYFAQRTLLGGDPDINRRMICAAPDAHDVCEFNRDMRIWTPAMQKEFDICLKALLASAE